MCKTNCNFEKLEKGFRCDIHSVRNVGNDDLNYVSHRQHDAHHQGRNFVKAKMCKIYSNFEKFQNAVNLIYTVLAML